MDRKMNPRAPESMQMSNPRGHHNYKKSEECIFKGFKIVLHTFKAYQNQIEIMRLGHYRTGKRIQEHMKVFKSRIRMGIIFTRNRKRDFLNV